jgi:hypothetical protein
VTADQIAKPRLLGGANGGFVANRQFVAAFGTPAGKHGTAIRRLHAFTKAVGLGPFAIIRLKSTFWHYNSFLNLFVGPGRLLQM